MRRKRKPLQQIWQEKVLSRLRDHFVTETGKVIEGNYDPGDYAPVIFDERSRRFLPVYKEKLGHQIAPPIPVLEMVRRRATQSCTVELLNLPAVVQPMRYPGEIKGDEVGGVDFIKTYYQYDISKCRSCSDEVEIGFTFQFETEEPIEHYDNEPNNHCVISQDGGCHGEVIDRGTDEGGNYIRWKVYTESTAYNRSGFGYFLIRASGKTGLGGVICSAAYLIKVDCCEKLGLIKPEIYWEIWEWGECSSPIFYYGGTALCAVPDQISMSDLLWYAAGEGGEAGRFYALPEIGGCPVYEWTLSGVGNLVDADPFRRMVTYHPPEIVDCNDTVLLRAEDRCDGTDEFFVKSCCDSGPEDLQIIYTSLVMGCGESQELHPMGGCGPYSWALTGGGGELVVPNPESGAYAIYHSPATNPNCVSNPTIKLTECCGNSAELKLAVNCVTDGFSLQLNDRVICPRGCYQVSGYYFLNANWIVARYDCEGNETFRCETNEGCVSEGGPLCGYGDSDCSNCAGCYTGQCGGGPCGLIDSRTEELKGLGCCPLNPLTGLPYD